MMNILKYRKNIIALSKLMNRPMFGFGGGHHDIDRTQVRLRDDAIGKINIIKGIIKTQMK